MLNESLAISISFFASDFHSFSEHCIVVASARQIFLVFNVGCKTKTEKCNQRYNELSRNNPIKLSNITRTRQSRKELANNFDYPDAIERFLWRSLAGSQNSNLHVDRKIHRKLWTYVGKCQPPPVEPLNSRNCTTFFYNRQLVYFPISSNENPLACRSCHCAIPTPTTL